MGVYIKGMEMPTKCCECLLAKLSPTRESIICSYMLSRVPWDERPFDCPLVPVPPHGRLIDADALAKRIKDEGRNQAEYYADRYAPVVMAYGDCHGKVQSAPTIIPAREEHTMEEFMYGQEGNPNDGSM